MGKRHNNVPDLRDYLEVKGGPGVPRRFARDKHMEHRTYPMHLSDDELALFDSYAHEHSRISGTPLRYYKLDIGSSTRDPLYDEPIEYAWNGPYEMVGVVTYPEREVEQKEEGKVVRFSAELWVARREFEIAGCPEPSEGDVAEFWMLPFYVGAGSALKSDPTGGGYFFDVTRAVEDGHIFDGAAFVGFLFELTRNTQFSPERRVFQRPGGECP